MGLSRRKKHIQYLSAAFCLMLALSSSEAMVLCVGQDGHVAIEASDSRCCGHLRWACCSHDAHTLAAAGSSAQNDDCGPCLDIPISSGSADTFQAPNEAPPDISVCLAVDLLRIARGSFLESHLDLKFLTPLSDFPPPRSIVLLI
jgi:hypothetical protein